MTKIAKSESRVRTEKKIYIYLCGGLKICNYQLQWSLRGGQMWNH